MTHLDGIAIVAVAGRFPGARDVEEFWQNLVAGRETISHFSEDELEPADPVDMESRRDPNYVRARGILDDIELFDAGFFKMSPREAEVTDPAATSVSAKPPGRRSSAPAMTPRHTTDPSASTRA